MRGTIAALLGAATLALPATAGAQTPTGPQPTLPIAQLAAGIHIIRAEVANTEASRRDGLMFRKELAGNDGMLFVFEQPDVQCFWMRNTLLPLSIAFIADDGTIVNIEDMAPQTDDTHCSKKPVRYALEMAQGWYDSHGMKAGRKIDGLP
ncbi:Uncharacterized ACR%2C COG1430 [Achromobacter sp. 2789STDY5608633]|uniref:DUF192 domain-containing protein n=2 Tax=Achromobacter TaxID=222 RepID=A0A6J5IBD6_9BURK|nr:hypothetical protein LMG26845_01183 [Achromobacter insuavis]CUI74794.1 Uncharacterized ACR%2C COG1430 [Achromobacter sp. 2789STDY5608628]CUI86752.1 Uncharacterized ACR%2C COG1430 [Achromobacter sp. 2789STDY5608633]CUJ09844.1 Uncharacterized ACR%2C COG1430 [Achromobacter sp. 2789STDY5608621]CUJ97498.1 Uncharacterized ACR%2C COG1430 [Achromobacter sp. 2789STDY5608615]